MRVVEFTGRSIGSLLSLIEEQPAGPRHLFRGQSDASWKLVPGLYRLPSPNISAKSLDESYSLYEAQLIDFFFREAFPYLPRVERGYSNDRIIAQHFGVPTRLLDWSSDPFVALFFALESWERDEDAAIYMLLPDARYLPEHVSGLGLHKAIAFTPLALDRRVPAQKSVFTFHPYGPDSARFVPLDDREDFGNKLAGTNGISSNGFLKIVVPQARKRVLFQDLLQKGVDRRNLFPGLDGVGSDIAQRAKCGQVW